MLKDITRDLRVLAALRIREWGSPVWLLEPNGSATYLGLMRRGYMIFRPTARRSICRIVLRRAAQYRHLSAKDGRSAGGSTRRREPADALAGWQVGGLYR